MLSDIIVVAVCRRLQVQELLSSAATVPESVYHRLPLHNSSRESAFTLHMDGNNTAHETWSRQVIFDIAMDTWPFYGRVFKGALLSIEFKVLTAETQ